MSIASIMGKVKSRPSFTPDKKWVLPDCLLGVEFEFEGVVDKKLPKHTFADFWVYHEETSLKNEGAEYVFSTPLFGTDASNALKWLVEYAIASKWLASARCGIHVHVDVRDLEVPQLAGMSIIYAIMEPFLYKWVGDSRENSHFCIPLYKADDALHRTCNLIKCAHNDSVYGGTRAFSQADAYLRYCGYNLQALAKFGTVEFRHLRTTTNLQRIEDWINMLLSVKASAYKLPESDGSVITLIEDMDVISALRYIFPINLADQLYSSVGTVEEARYLFHDIGLNSARDIAIHGCHDRGWFKASYPKGQHSGYSTWFKANALTLEENSVIKKTTLSKYKDFNAEELNRVIIPMPRPEELNPINWEAPNINLQNFHIDIQEVLQQRVDALEPAEDR
jgi:hypothetical protein